MRPIIRIAVGGLFAVTAMAFVPRDHGNEIETGVDAHALTARAVVEAVRGPVCGEEVTCLGAEHKIVSNGQPIGTWAGAHPCWGPADHAGPSCDEVTFATAETVRDMSFGEVLDYIARQESNLVYNERWAAIDVLNCGGTLILARVPVAELAE